MAAGPDVRRLGRDLRWRASVEGGDAGGLRVVVRPDGRRFARFDSCRDGVERTLLAAVDAELGSVLHLTVDESDEAALRRYERVGFAVHRRESAYAIPTDPGVTGLAAAATIPGVALVAADRVDEARLRLLDDALRQDVPGTDGWRWDETAFRDETFDPAYFDPATYLVAVEEAAGAYVGLVRVWNNPGAPRLGLVGVLPAHRRRGLARTLLGHVLAVLHGRGVAQVGAEVDDANRASRALLCALGARRIGGTVELRREAAAGRAAT